MRYPRRLSQLIIIIMLAVSSTWLSLSFITTRKARAAGQVPRQAVATAGRPVAARSEMTARKATAPLDDRIVQGPAALVQVFGNNTPITISDNTIAMPYPSTITVSNVNPATVTRVSVILSGLTHTNPDDVNVLLVGPGGQRTVLIADAGGADDVTGLTLTFSPIATASLPDETTLTTGTYRPGNYGTLNDDFPAPGPGALNEEAPDLNVFNLTNPNGDWKLFVTDDRTGDTGQITNGWSLVLAVPQVFTVTKIADTNDGTCDADCSLREAITAAGNLDLINFSSLFNTPQTINLLTALPEITRSITIQGPGANLLTVRRADAAPDFRIFTISSGVSQVALSGLTISNGRDLRTTDFGGFGGGIFSQSNLTLTNVVVTGNQASDGGGVVLGAVDGVFTGCTFTGNTSNAGGGGIEFLSGGGHTLRMVKITVRGNRAAFSGGGIANVSALGGNSRLELVNSTIASNSGGGIFTLSQGAVDSTATTTLRNTIIAGNTPNNLATQAGGGAATFTTLGFNLTNDNSTAFLNQATDLINSNPLLGPLQDNGGPTPTHALLAGSPALDKGSSAGIALDQRGLGRAFDVPGIAAATGGDNSDIGAVEMQAVVVANTNDTGTGSLRNAIQTAPANSDILFDPVVFNTPRTITASSGEIAITRNMTITSPARNLLTISGGDQNRVFNISANAIVRLSGMTITNGRSPSGQSGGAILNNGTLSVTNCIIARSVATSSGGGGIFSSGQLSIDRSLIFGNSANDVGGVWAEGRGLTMTSSTVSGNTATFATAGVYIANSTIGATLTSCTISGNTAANLTGGVRNLNSPLTLTSCTIASNRSNDGGGGASFSGPAFLRNTIVANNSGQQMATSTTGIVVTSQGFNLASDNGGGFLTQPTDLRNTDPLLGGLGDNGGPTTTHALLLNSPALDKGNSFGEARDQRGVRRGADDPVLTNAAGGDGSDIGAFERSLTIAASAASFKRDTLAQESIVAVGGENLTTNTAVGSTVPLPTTLDSTTVSVLDAQSTERQAPLFFVSPAQINFQIPPGTAVGNATIIIRRNSNVIASTTVAIAAVEPSLFTANSNGAGVPAAFLVRVKADGSQVNEPVAIFQGGIFVPAPISLGPQGEQLVLVLYGTGIRNRSALGAVSLRIGTETLGVVFAGPIAGFVGLEQINSVTLPRTLAGTGTVNVTLTVDGKPANTVTLHFQ